MTQPISTSNTNIETPLGVLSFGVSSTEGDLSNVKITPCEIEPTLPEGMHVEKCIAIIMQCTSSKPLKKINFSCSWLELKEKGYPCSGEGLEAWEWEHNETTLTIGTEDDEFLNSRIKQNNLTVENYSISMNNNTILIEINEFPINNELSLHYVIAWNSLPETTNDSCWFAVDTPHEKLLTICQ